MVRIITFPQGGRRREYEPNTPDTDNASFNRNDFRQKLQEVAEELREYSLFNLQDLSQAERTKIEQQVKRGVFLGICLDIDHAIIPHNILAIIDQWSLEYALKNQGHDGSNMINVMSGVKQQVVDFIINPYRGVSPFVKQKCTSILGKIS